MFDLVSLWPQRGVDKVPSHKSSSRRKAADAGQDPDWSEDESDKDEDDEEAEVTDGEDEEKSQEAVEEDDEQLQEKSTKRPATKRTLAKWPSKKLVRLQQTS